MLYAPNTGPLSLVREYPIGVYRVDFCNLLLCTVIELDGLKHHKTAEDIAHDRKRERELEALGYKVVRIGGKEITDDTFGIAVEMLDLLTYSYALYTGTPVEEVQEEVNCTV